MRNQDFHVFNRINKIWTNKEQLEPYYVYILWYPCFLYSSVVMTVFSHQDLGSSETYMETVNIHDT